MGSESDAVDVNINSTLGYKVLRHNKLGDLVGLKQGWSSWMSFHSDRSVFFRTFFHTDPIRSAF